MTHPYGPVPYRPGAGWSATHAAMDGGAIGKPCPLCQAPSPTQRIRYADRKVCLECSLDIPLELHVPDPEVTV